MMIYSSSLKQNMYYLQQQRKFVFIHFLQYKFNQYSYEPQLVVLEGHRYLQGPHHKVEELMDLGSAVLKSWLY